MTTSRSRVEAASGDERLLGLEAQKRGNPRKSEGFTSGSDGTRTRDLRRDRPESGLRVPCRTRASEGERVHGCREKAASGHAVEPTAPGPRSGRSGVEMASEGSSARRLGQDVMDLGGAA